MENEFDADALNAGLNADTDPKDPYENQEEEEAEVAAEEAPAEESAEETEDHAEPEERPLSKAEQRHQKLANERTAEREQRLLAEQRAQLLEAQLAEVRRGQQRPAEDENLDPMEKWTRDTNQTLAQIQFRQQDVDDRSAFLHSVSKTPSELAYVDRVEAQLAQARKNGHNPLRENVLIYLMGQDARKKMAAAPEIKKAAAERVKAAQGKPLGTKSNVAPSKAESSVYDRLKDITL